MMRNKSISKSLMLLLMLISFTIVSCNKEPEPSNGNEEIEIPDNPNDSDHPIDNGYAKIRVEMTSNYKEICDFRYYQFDFHVFGQCNHADRNVKDRTVESIMGTPWVYETEFSYHGDEFITIFLQPEYNGDLSDLSLEQIQSLFATIKLYYNDELVKTGDRMVSYTLPYADYK